MEEEQLEHADQAEEVQNRNKPSGAEQHLPQKHKTEDTRKKRFVYGNYDRYYGYRILKSSDEDPRLKYFEKEWFEGKDCLDVGCNTGNLTIAIARKFSCKTMLGIDIDPALVGRATKLLALTASKFLSRAFHGQLDETAEGKILSLGERSQMDEAYESSTGLDTSSSCNGLSDEELLKRVTFRTENFIDRLESDATYDTVLCLSLTKWVHLNWGDNGLIRLFAKIRHLLRPGGLLVLEPQPWKSYKSKHLVSEVVRKNFSEILLRPEHFREVLLDKVGYRSMESVARQITQSSTGFSRPIFLIRV